MNSNFDRKQIIAYAMAFKEGDAIWCDGKWWEAYCEGGALTNISPNQYFINRNYGDLAVIGGFENTSAAASQFPYRVTTLADYELQGGEKIVCLTSEFSGLDIKLGEVFCVGVNDNQTPTIVNEKGDEFIPHDVKSWGVIPRYEQVKGSADPNKKEPKFKVGDIVNLKGYDIPLTIRSVNVTKEVPEAYTYVVKFDSGNISTYWESDLELAEESSKTTLTEKVNEVVNVKMNEQSTEVNFDEVAIHSEIITRLVKQTIKGVKKYGDPVKHDNLSAVEWIDHAIDESIDQIVYLTALKQSLMSKGDEK